MHQNKKILATIAITLMLSAVVVFGIAIIVHAQASLDLPGNFAGFSSQDIKKTIENIVRIVLGFIGIIFLLLVLYAGFLWMTSRGEEDKISRAKKILVSAVIGLVITLSAYAIATFIIRSWKGMEGPGGLGGPGGPGQHGFGFALGAGALESHYPGRNAKDVPRNTNIFVTFKETIDPATFCTGGLVNQAYVQISDVNGVVPSPDGNDVDNNDILENVACSTVDQLTFKLDPAALMGISSGNTLYRVWLTNGITKTNGDTALPLGYIWHFTVGTVVDETPPTIVSVYPKQSPPAFPRNVVVQINFSEPVDPGTSSGIAPPFANIRLSTGAISMEGSYISSNQYRTTEFITNEACGINSCGRTIYCLPGAATIDGVVRGTAGVGYNPITDMAGNALDGDKNFDPADPATVGGDYSWSFDTTNDLDLAPPVMTSRLPSNNQADVDVFDPIETNFSELLSASTLKSNNIGLSWPPNDDQINYWISKDNIDANADGDPDFTRVFIHHDTYKPLQPYHPGADSDIQDLYQNCYFPSSCNPGPC